MIIQNLWQAHYQIFSTEFLKEFIKLNVNIEKKNGKKCGFFQFTYVQLYVIVFLNAQTLNMI